ncbi:MAG: HD domain-containing protein, partial [Gemmatimonadales bacterium]
MTSTAPILAPELAEAVAAQRDRLDVDVLARAYRLSAQAHHGQKRMSGDDFVSHSVAVATILAEQQMDTTTIAAALLHDVVEDSDVTLERLRRDFGNEVADLVDGLTKISTLTFRSSAEEQAENYRKLLMSVARDARVIIIKLADRLHNMRTLDPLPEDKRRRIALETRELYAPLAHRFGMAGVKAELEDLAFQHLEPDEYKQLARQVKARRVERDRTIERLRVPLADELRRAGIVGWEITGRPKNLWSIHKKMKKRDKPFEEIYDLLAVRVLVHSITDCYHVLGIIHHTWTPLQERIK